MHIERVSPIYKSFRTEQIRGMFDLPHKESVSQCWDVELKLEENPWLIGLILGPSGSGKTTLARECFKQATFHDGFEWSQKQSLLDGFPKALKTTDIVQTLASVGLSSPPHWVKPYAHLSNGQKFRADLARLILSEKRCVIFDEFTSIVDRDVAKVCCATLSKTIRQKKEPQFIALSCHYDILDWLQPDWVYDVGIARFEWRRLRRRPVIELEIFETDAATWALFKGHHYLSADLNRSAQCFVALWHDKPVAFSSVLHFPHARVRNFKREHRTVVLPDYQGIGIGNAISEHIGRHYLENGFRFISTTSHPSMIWHRQKSPLWRCIRTLSHTALRGRSSSSEVNNADTNSRSRMTAAFEFIGS